MYIMNALFAISFNGSVYRFLIIQEKSSALNRTLFIQQDLKINTRLKRIMKTEIASAQLSLCSFMFNLLVDSGQTIN